MGIRSWLTPITDKSQWDEVQASIEENPYSYGIHYVIRIKGECSFPVGSLVIAWSADGTYSVNELRPDECRNNTWLLDNFLDEFPEWHTEPGGPNKFGTMLTSEDEVLRVFKNGDED